MKMSFKAVAVMLIFTTAWLCAAQRTEAMLVPANVSAPVNPQIDRAADLATIQTTLESKVIREKLHAMGLSDAEIQYRLSRLSNDQVHQMASQIRAVNPAGGIIIGILIAVLLVVLIIYLIKRI